MSRAAGESGNLPEILHKKSMIVEPRQFCPGYARTKWRGAEKNLLRQPGRREGTRSVVLMEMTLDKNLTAEGSLTTPNF